MFSGFDQPPALVPTVGNLGQPLTISSPLATTTQSATLMKLTIINCTDSETVMLSETLGLETIMIVTSSEIVTLSETLIKSTSSIVASSLTVMLSDTLIKL